MTGLLMVVVLISGQINWIEVDPKTFLPLNVGNYWVFGVANAYDTIEDFMSREYEFNFWESISIDKDSLINGIRYYHINRIFPDRNIFENMWLCYDELGNVIGLDSNLNNKHKVLNFGDLKEALLNSSINKTDGLFNPDNGLRSFPFRYFRNRYPVFSYCFGCLENGFWSCGPVWWKSSSLSSYPSGYYEEVYCPNIGFYTFVFDNTFIDVWKLCLIEAYIDGVLYKDIQNTSPSTWLDLKKGK